MYNTAQKFEKLKGKEDMLVLGIESSCDETAAAVVLGSKILSSVIASQIDIHQRYGGVVPEIASRNHLLEIIPVINDALEKAHTGLDKIDAIAVTFAPGLIGSLLVGVSAAKSLSFAKNIPLIGINHIEAHIAACYANNFDLQPPFLACVASGGHTSIIEVKGYNDFKKLDGTLDDAIGEAFDKVGRVLGLPYPGGPNVDKLAKEGQANIKFTKSTGLNSISYSGLKTAVINYVHKLRQKQEEINIADICASFNKEAADMLVNSILKAAGDKNYETIVLAGGVAANSYLRAELTKRANGIRIVIPPLDLCGDNAAMVAIRGFYAGYEGVGLSDLNLNAMSVVK
ncbi:MAG: tRNA (adenosine(37)-N6)-threonylcarbamoyltransferase complex transferase subunit TsaD [Firmicutes bacterium]|nr:tRNA (adenosine(37)-N6)-threonylcarbamoyltransferase complex transferase subunit TsaD [Bacillota bacterium]